MDLSEFDFELDESLIAKYPVKNRDESRLMVVEKKTGKISIEPFFKNIKNYLKPNDLLVFNNTKVSKRRAFLLDEKNKKYEVLFLEKLKDSKSWLCLIKNLKKLPPHLILKSISGDYKFQFVGRKEIYGILEPQDFINEFDFENFGEIPIPPYFKRNSEKSDEKRYQTVFSENLGSVAAPTAGLHFSKELLEDLKKKGVLHTSVELKIGYGTFSPIITEQILNKKLHKETYSISKESAKVFHSIDRTKQKICAVGTTTLRVLETEFLKNKGKFTNGEGETDLFIFPEDSIQSIDSLVTNFHLPKSSLLLLVSAFAGKELILEAYKKAISEKMRFFSYGDSMLIL
ncbi:MAG: tRNA preQ1(34) S-adenosylmethionine ribosyltransferase-isomerase QueA [Leptospiraceae bacterium]|nr:tRNA preQ1(34) S-adenosylmethionine ribosyltransferase-isomerase QueA [Leptospiraceae bacterium]MCK6382170.1 tRNA preQ1(34) S-adenosylmethionine ribosyltransferase-isomerase QueA [Leptospiraceae bacterium]NUM40991.1 tRNA preQ1(34) S-adenosylmethionine ribosyltransferase-isomerase QueA [Leptospiraceae bacterium]